MSKFNLNVKPECDNPHVIFVGDNRKEKCLLIVTTPVGEGV